jgi:hypothetical protein
MKLTLIFILSVTFLSTTLAQEKTDAKNGRAVIEQMYKQYKNKWYKKVTFTQQTTFYKDGKPEREETWYEALSIPEGLAIKFGDMKAGNGITFRADSQFVWNENKITSRVKRVHALLVLGFSVYLDSPEQTIAKLQEAGYDFDKFELDITADGKTEFVIGDPEKWRFWIDAETFLFKRMNRKDRNGNLIETQFNKYEKLGKGWIATEVLFLKNNELTMKEVYRDIALPKKLPANLLSTTEAFSELSW